MSSVAITVASATPGIGAQGKMLSGTAGAPHTDSKGKGGGSGRASFRHINDLVSVGVNLDPHTPLRKVLELGDSHMRQAITFNDFRRPDLALQEYIKAFTIAVDMIPRHKDYPSMKADRGDLNRLYNALKLKITSNGALFDKIKDDIKQDNQRSGVQPASASGSMSNISNSSELSSYTSQQSQAEDGQDATNKASTANGNGVGRKQKPAVQPKPQALHGNAIKQAKKSPQDPQEDLADRFARLRDSKKPAPGTTANSTAHQSLPSLDTSIVTMPKVPQAIYNPVRGTVTSEVANLPSSSPRGMFSRTNSITTIPSAPARMLPENAISAYGKAQFVAANTYGASEPRKTPARAQIPAGDTISATTLADLISQYPQNILIIDVRDRESFDEGHIRSHGTICVEPEILMRENISADEIVDSMVLSPTTERLAIEQRDKVDLVVIYDDDSSSIPARVTGNSSEMIIYNIRQALLYYSYGRPLKDAPKLLRGGLDSWIHQFGEQSLEISDSISGHALTNSRIAPRYGRRRRSRKARTLSSNEVQQFEDMINEDENSAFDYVKTRDDFIRRYPTITAGPESMLAPVSEKYAKAGHPLDPQEEDYLTGLVPAPPKRPAPAVPRTRYSGLESTDDDSNIGALAKMASGSNTGTENPPQYLTGLEQGQNNCFMNALVQILLASPRFIDEFLSKDFPQNWRTPSQLQPRQPQLLCKIVANLLQWLHRKEFQNLRIGTLVHYLRAIHPGYAEVPDGEGKIRIVKFGDGNQHDPDELWSFMSIQFKGETDVQITRLSPPNIPDGEPEDIKKIVRLLWADITGKERPSLFHKHFNICSVQTRTCNRCKSTFTRTVNEETLIPSTALSLLGFLEGNYKNEASFRDEGGCGIHSPITVLKSFMRVPPLLRLNINHSRYAQVVSNDRSSANYSKDMSFYDVPLDLDLTAFTFDEKIRKRVNELMPAPFNEGIASPPKYELYGVQVHQGQSLSAGHYWSYVRQKGSPRGRPTTNWLKCDDTNITLLTRSQFTTELKSNQINRHGLPVTPVQAFYKRIDVPYSNYQYNDTGPGIEL